MLPMPDDKALRARTPGTYVINEVFYSLQGEGINAGVPMVFIRFSDCNLRCARNNDAQFDCDTEFLSGREMTIAEVDRAIHDALARDAIAMLNEKGMLNPRLPQWLLLTGGEPLLQVDLEFLKHFMRGWNIAIETNGTRDIPRGEMGYITSRCIWICVSPKSAEHTIQMRQAHEVKYVRRAGQAIPRTVVETPNKLISPAAQSDGSFLREDVEWCVNLVKENPEWRLSLQLHKLLNVR